MGLFSSKDEKSETAETQVSEVKVVLPKQCLARHTRNQPFNKGLNSFGLITRWLILGSEVK
jgi:hypothetical protein